MGLVSYVTYGMYGSVAREKSSTAVVAPMLGLCGGARNELPAVLRFNEDPFFGCAMILWGGGLPTEAVCVRECVCVWCPILRSTFSYNMNAPCCRKIRISHKSDIISKNQNILPWALMRAIVLPHSILLDRAG